MTQGHRWLLFGSCWRSDRVSSPTTLLNALFTLFRWISISWPFIERSLKPSQVYAMSAIRRSCLKLLSTWRTNLCCVNFCGQQKGEPLHLAMKSITFSFSLNSVSISSRTTLLWCRRTAGGIVLHLPIENGVFRETCVPSKGCPLSDRIKSCNKDPLWLVDRYDRPLSFDLGFLAPLNNLNSGILKFGGKTIDSIQAG